MRAHELIEALERAGQRTGLLEDGNGGTIVLLERGGRIIGLFPAGDARNVLWAHPDIADPDRFQQRFLSQGDWNTGGERTWISPELEYFVRDGKRFWETYEIPSALDPGGYALQAEPGSRQAWLAHRFELQAYRAGAKVGLSLEKRIRPIPDPLRLLAKQTILSYGYAGFEAAVKLEGFGGSPAAPVSCWTITQVPAGGCLWVPTYGEAAVTDFFGTREGAELSIRPGLLTVRLYAVNQYKGSITAPSLTGRAAYYREEADGVATLLVRSFYANPSGHYSDAPPHAPEESGHCLQFYSDNGQLGRFGELEYHTPVIAENEAFGNCGLTDVSRVWSYSGPIPTITRIRKLLVGH